METILAKALYDNAAESPDELAFHKGDVVVVIEKIVEGSVGWWKCSLHGQEGLAPANRLRLLSPSECIYQIPCVSQKSHIYKLRQQADEMPSTHTVQSSPVLLQMKSETLERSISLKKMPSECSTPSPTVYAIPRLGRKDTIPTPFSSRTIPRKPSTIIQKRFEIMDIKRTPCEIYDVPPTATTDLNYDIPTPSKYKPQLKAVSSYSTLPDLRKREQIYDVPVIPEMPTGVQGFYGMLPSKGASSQKDLYDIPPKCAYPSRVHDIRCLYDIPKCHEKSQQREESNPPEKECIYDVPPSIKQRKPVLNGLTIPNQKVTHPSDEENVSKTLEYRYKPELKLDHPYGCSHWGRKIMLSRELEERGAKTTENKEKNGRAVSLSENQRNSTVSNSSTTSSSSCSSCDSLMFGSSSPEPLREVTLSPEEATQRLLQLQDTVCQAVPKLMQFVSSHWRSRQHLGQHLQEIRAASEDVAHSISSFLNFALDIRGNAQRLTDSNLQARLQKQISIVEDSGLILQTSVDALRDLGWTLDGLVQDDGQPQSPDQLERFVMITRTLPEDLKRLVSIINANSKLLFPNSAKESEVPKDPSPQDVRKRLVMNEPPRETKGDEDYVQLQTKTEFEKQQESEARNDLKLEANTENKKKTASKPEPTSPDSTNEQPCKPVISDHCRLYFGAIKKAIAVFVTSLEEKNPPEKFISHSKLVIMIGQRLIDTLFSEAQKRQDSQELLHKINHLCALLKQLAVATKKAALHFPDQVAIQEAQNFAKELSQIAHQFRLSLDS